jgi:hypothetical protein
MSRVSRPRAGKTRESVLDLSDTGLTSLADLPVYPDLEELIVDNNHLSSFRGLKPQPKLATIRARGNSELEYLNGLREQPALQDLDIRGSKLDAQPGFRAVALATVGRRLMVLNGEALTRREQELADTYAARGRFFLEPEAEGAPEAGGDEEAAVFSELHAREHSEFFDAFAQNEAVLWELKECGPLPFVDETSAEADLCAAIENIRDRIDRVREKIREFRPAA